MTNVQIPKCSVFKIEQNGRCCTRYWYVSNTDAKAFELQYIYKNGYVYAYDKDTGEIVFIDVDSSD
jgi:hypothetical protein